MGQKKNSGKVQDKGLQQEISGVVTIFCSLFLIYGVFSKGNLGALGGAGNWLIEFLFGLMGNVMYIFPFFSLIFGIQLITKSAKQRNKFCKFSIFFMLSISFLLFLINEETLNVETSMIGLIKHLYRQGQIPTGGGVISFLVAPFINFFGLVGTYIIFICVAIVCFFVLTDTHPASVLLWIRDRIRDIKNTDNDFVKEFANKEKPKKELKLKINDKEIPNEIPIEKFDLANQIGIDEVKDGKTETKEELDIPEASKIDKTEIKKEEEKTVQKQEGNKDNRPIPTINIDTVEPEAPNYVLPPIDILQKPKGGGTDKYKKELVATAEKLQDTLDSFGVSAKVINVSRGPAVTRYELAPNAGVKVSKIVGLTDDIALNLAAPSIRMEAPIPGKAAVGIEIPNTSVDAVFLREILDTDDFNNHSSKIAFGLGKDTAGKPMIADIAKMPHVLIAGATGSGKSVCINTIITSLLYRAKPNEVKLIMIDPKVVELGVYNGIPHLLIPVVTDPKKAAGALNWAVQEMVNRYNLFAQKGVRDMKGYNEALKAAGEDGALPHIVIIVDELADLMMVAPNDVEDAICRLAQMARAAGMHLVIATQRPSVDVITGLIKANVPSRIAFAVSSQVDSRTILDMAGAEKLLGKGDMLFYPMGASKPMRVQGAFVTDKEVEQIVEFIKSKNEVKYDEDVLEKIQSGAVGTPKTDEESEDVDALLNDVISMVVDLGQASTSLIQRRFKVGYARAARIIDQMEERGIISGFDGTKPRQVLITKENWEELQATGNK